MAISEIMINSNMSKFVKPTNNIVEKLKRIYNTITKYNLYQKGKPSESQGRKAKGLRLKSMAAGCMEPL